VRGVTRTVAILIGLLVAFLTVASLQAADSVTVPIAFHSTVAPSTSLHVSQSELLVEVPAGSTATVYAGSIEFRALARTRTGGDVLLSVETDAVLAGPVDSPGGPAVADANAASLQFEGSGTGTLSGVLAQGTQQIVGRWSGSGLLTGTVQFRLEGALTPGFHRIPLRFVLTAP